MESTGQKKTSPPDWDKLYQVAAGQSGYFTRSQAGEAGYSGPLLFKYMKKNRIERVGWGIYRLVHFPPSEHEELVQLRLRFDNQAVYSHQTALQLHGLSDILPAHVHITLPKTWRKRRLKKSENLNFYFEDLSDEEITWVGPVQVTIPARSIEDCASVKTSPEIVHQSIEQGLERGMFKRRDVLSSLRYISSYGFGGS